MLTAAVKEKIKCQQFASVDADGVEQHADMLHSFERS